MDCWAVPMHADDDGDSQQISSEEYWAFAIRSGSEDESEESEPHDMFCEYSDEEEAENTLWQMRAKYNDDEGVASTAAGACECAETAPRVQSAESDMREMIVEQAHVESMHADELNFENMMTSSHLCCADLLKRRIENRVVSVLDEDTLVPLRLDKFSPRNRARLLELHSRVCATVSRHTMGRFQMDGCRDPAALSAKIDILAQMVARELQHVALTLHRGHPVVMVNTQRYDVEISYKSGGTNPNARQQGSIMSWLRLALLGRLLHHLLLDGVEGMRYGEDEDDVLSYIPLVDAAGEIIPGSPVMMNQKTFSLVIPSFGAVVEIPEDSDQHLSVILVMHQPCLDAFAANAKTLDSLVDGKQTMAQLVQANVQRLVAVQMDTGFASYLLPVPQ